MEFHNPELLPLIPERLLREHHVHERYDGRFRAAARLLQALWRERRGAAIGHHVSHTGARRRLGSMLAPSAARAGDNFLSETIFGQARCDLAYREPGALIDAERMWTNMLSSMPLAFNLLAPLKTDKALARRMFARIAPGVASQIAHLQFEHAPGRGDPTFTADGTAFDAFVSGRTADRRKCFIAIEVKYSESMTEPEARLRPRYDELSRSSGLYVDPDNGALRSNPIQSLWREHMLAQSMVDADLYDSGVFMLITPRQNRDVQRAAHRYAATLAADPTKVAFLNIELEEVIEAYRQSGSIEHAEALEARYTDFSPIHDLVRSACFASPRRRRGHGTADRKHPRQRPTPSRPAAAAAR